MVIVPGAGPLPCDVFLCGEAPGREEAARLTPFVGRSGEEQELYLSRHGLTARKWRRNNVVQEYREGNPDPTAEQIREWTPRLISEVHTCNPRLIIAVGRFAVQFFLGQDATMELTHGLPHRAGAFDPTRRDRAPANCTILPVTHPAAGLYDTDLRSSIAWDYSRVAWVLDRIKRGEDIDYREDTHLGRERYEDVTGAGLRSALHSHGDGISFSSDTYTLGLDTEGTPDDPWSIQVSPAEGFSYVLRRSQPDFRAGISYLQSLASRPGCTFVMHNALYDLPMCRAMGLDLSAANIWDTMYAAYLTRLEPQGLKPLAWRWCGMRMSSYSETVGDVGRQKQIDYLLSAISRDWPTPEPRIIHENDGTSRLYRPQSIERRAEKILTDTLSGDLDKDGNPTDPYARWKAVDKELRADVESVLGPMPVGTLDDIPLSEAVRYSARDADATLRLYNHLAPELERLGLSQLMSDGMSVLPIFEEMQATGLPASRSHFSSLSAQMWEEMCALQSRISTRYFSGRPFNPGSPKQVATLLRRRGQTAAKRTSTGDASTAKGSIEHLRYTDPAISDIFEWRERQHIKDSFCAPVLNRIPADSDSNIHPVRCTIKTTRTATRRLATTDPNLLAIPSRTEMGLRVRAGYQCPPGETFGAWDLSAIEMRVMAHESQDPLMCELFREGRDIHSETAARIFGIGLDQVDKLKHRYPAKTSGFGILYGIQGPGLLTQLRMLGLEGWTERSCEELIRGWLRVYGGVAEYIKRTASDTRKTGEVRDHWGMIRYLPAIWSKDSKLAAEAERHAVSHKIQGGAQGMIQNSMRWLRPHVRELQQMGLNVHWSLQVHDEIILRFSEDLWDILNPLVMEALTEHSGIELRVPIEANGQAATKWSELK